MTNALLYAATVLIWGSTWFAVRLQLGVVPPELSVAYRFTLAGAILLAYCVLRGRPARLGWRAHGLIALQGLCLFCVNYVLFYNANAYLPSGLLAVAFSILLWFNVLNGAWFLGTPIRARVVSGGVVGFLGMCLLFWPEVRDFDLESGGLRGLLLAVIATVFVSFGNILSSRNQRAGLSVLASNAYGMAYGGIFTLIYALAIGVPILVDTSPAYVASFAYLVVFGSIIAFGTYLTLLGRIGADRASYAMVLFPVIALVISTIFEGYVWTPTGLAGIALILCGNLLVLRRTTPPSAVARKADAAAH
jgi:drug/metabolite transporter (DMT)-like permease